MNSSYIIVVMAILMAAFSGGLSGYSIAKKEDAKRYQQELQTLKDNTIPTGVYKSDEDAQIIEGATFMIMKHEDNGHSIMVAIDLSTKQMLVENGATKEDKARFDNIP